MRASTRRRFRKGARRQAKAQDLKIDHRATKAEVDEIKASMMGKPKQVVPKKDVERARRQTSTFLSDTYKKHEGNEAQSSDDGK